MKRFFNKSLILPIFLINFIGNIFGAAHIDRNKIYEDSLVALENKYNTLAKSLKNVTLDGTAIKNHTDTLLGLIADSKAKFNNATDASLKNDGRQYVSDVERYYLTDIPSLRPTSVPLTPPLPVYTQAQKDAAFAHYKNFRAASKLPFNQADWDAILKDPAQLKAWVASAPAVVTPPPVVYTQAQKDAAFAHYKNFRAASKLAFNQADWDAILNNPAQLKAWVDSAPAVVTPPPVVYTQAQKDAALAHYKNFRAASKLPFSQKEWDEILNNPGVLKAWVDAARAAKK